VPSNTKLRASSACFRSPGVCAGLPGWRRLAAERLHEALLVRQLHHFVAHGVGLAQQLFDLGPVQAVRPAQVERRISSRSSRPAYDIDEPRGANPG
jgi:hypothetical protein